MNFYRSSDSCLEAGLSLFIQSFFLSDSAVTVGLASPEAGPAPLGSSPFVSSPVGSSPLATSPF